MTGLLFSRLPNLIPWSVVIVPYHLWAISSFSLHISYCSRRYPLIHLSEVGQSRLNILPRNANTVTWPGVEPTTLWSRAQRLTTLATTLSWSVYLIIGSRQMIYVPFLILSQFVSNNRQCASQIRTQSSSLIFIRYNMPRHCYPRAVTYRLFIFIRPFEKRDVLCDRVYRRAGGWVGVDKIVSAQYLDKYLT
jgi:hypothetical protein